MEKLEQFLLLSVIVLFVYVFYKWLLRYMRSKDIQGSFPYVFPFEVPVKDNIPLAFELPKPARVKASLINKSGDVAQELLDSEYPAGKAEVKLSLESLERGEYELLIEFPNQTTRRYIEVI